MQLALAPFSIQLGSQYSPCGLITASPYSLQMSSSSFTFNTRNSLSPKLICQSLGVNGGKGAPLSFNCHCSKLFLSGKFGLRTFAPYTSQVCCRLSRSSLVSANIC